MSDYEVMKDMYDDFVNKSKAPKPDNVNHPSHYNVGGIEVYDVIKTYVKGIDGAMAVPMGNVIKYILRWKNKNGLEDLKKAQWYLNELIKEVEYDNGKQDT